MSILWMNRGSFPEKKKKETIVIVKLERGVFIVIQAESFPRDLKYIQFNSEQ